MQAAPINVTLTGSLYGFDEKLVKRGSCNIYDDNDKFLAKVDTDSRGRFTAKLNLPRNQDVNLVFRRLLIKSGNPEIEENSLLARTFSFLREKNETEESKRSIKVAKQIDLEKICMDNKYAKEQVPLCYQKDLGIAALEAKSLTSIETLKESLYPYGGIAELQKGFGVDPIPLTAENVWKSLTDGICPYNFRRKSSPKGNLLTARFNWDRYEFDKLKSLPNAKVVFIEDDSKQPQIQKIKFHFRETLSPSSLKADKGVALTYKPHNSKFEEGIQKLNSVILLHGQIRYHLSWGHLYVANVAQMAFDNLQGTIYGEKLVLPFSSMVRFISNEAGKKDIFGTDGILNCSGLSVGGISQACYDVLGGIDFATFEPRAPFNDDHKFAHAQKIYYEMLKKTVTQIVKDNWQNIATQDWPKIHKFFKELHKSSADYHPWEEGLAKDGDWVDASEIGGGTHPEAPERTKYRKSDATVRSMRPVATNHKRPQSADFDMLTLFASHYIHCSTFRHTMAHHSQFEGTLAPHSMDIRYSPITLENYGVDGAYGGISYDDAAKQLTIGTTFKKFPEEHYTLLTSKNVPEEILHGAAEISDQMLTHGVDVAKMMVSTVI